MTTEEKLTKKPFVEPDNQQKKIVSIKTLW